MALQISPTLSTPHFILLAARRFTAAQRRRREQSCTPSFPEKRPTLGGGWEPAGSHSRAAAASLTMPHGLLLQGELGLSLRLIWRPLPWCDQLRGLCDVSIRVCVWRPLAAVCVCACDRAPRCCSDVSSLCPSPRTVTPVLSWGTWVSGLTLHSASQPSPHPLPFRLPSCTLNLH